MEGDDGERVRYGKQFPVAGRIRFDGTDGIRSPGSASTEVITVLSDTHGRQEPHLSGRARAAVEAAAAVLHAGDFTTTDVLDGFEDASETLYAVHGNVDTVGVRTRLPAVRTFEEAGVRFVLVHGHERGATSRAMLGRQEDADVVISGHTHRPGVADAGDVTLLNPGSHADPRGSVATHAELEPTRTGVRGRVVDVDGHTIDVFDV